MYTDLIQKFAIKVKYKFSEKIKPNEFPFNAPIAEDAAAFVSAPIPPGGNALPGGLKTPQEFCFLKQFQKFSVPVV